MIVNALYANIWRILARAIVQVSGLYGGRVFYNTAPSEVDYPYLIYQSDSSLGYNINMLNTTAWKGIITMRSVSNTLAGASDSLAHLLSNINGPIVVSGLPYISIPYDVQFYPYKAYSFPIERVNNTAVYTAGVGFETFITPR
jgi:hypothetical protein